MTAPTAATPDDGPSLVVDASRGAAAPSAETVRWLAPLTLMAAAFALVAAGWSAYENDWTADEPAHLAWSRRLLEHGLTERRSVLHYNSKTPVTVSNELSRRFAKRVLGVRDPRLVRFAARVPGLFWLALVLALTFLLARRCAGPVAGHLATLAVALDPNLIANSSIATVDSAYAAATLLTVAAALGFAQSPSLRWGAALGLALGLAFSVKFTAFLLLPGVVLLPLAVRGGASRLWSARGRVFAAGLLVAVVATAVIDAAYFFKQVGVPLGDGAWRSRAFTTLAGAFPSLALPLPVDFLTGLDICLNSERTKAFNVVIFGHQHPSGVVYYFAVLWILKTPVMLLLALLYGLARTLFDGMLRSNTALRYVALHLVLGLAYFSFVFRMQIGYRFVLMCVPLVAILAAASLAGQVRHRLFAAGLAVVVLTALAENVAYLGNSLAFTSAAVLPKREAFRLLADSNIDYSQNREKMEAWYQGQQSPTRHLDPVHILPGENIVRLNLASGVDGFLRYEWVRANLSPRSHFRHTYLFFDVGDQAFEQFLSEARRYGPSPIAEKLCPSGDPRAIPIDPASPASFSPGLAWPVVDLVCAWAADTTDLVLRSESGEVVWGRAEWPRRQWNALRESQEIWYRLDPGAHAFVAAGVKRFRGRWVVRGGPVTLAVRRESFPRVRTPQR